MFYLVKETMGRKKCIDINENNVYGNNQFYDCLKNHPFDEHNKYHIRSIEIRCINAPGKLTEADVYSDIQQGVS
jgi:hypothetical protein